MGRDFGLALKECLQVGSIKAISDVFGPAFVFGSFRKHLLHLLNSLILLAEVCELSYVIEYDSAHFFDGVGIFPHIFSCI